jgi:dynein heavy chain
MMLQESQRVKSKIPTAFEALMGPHTSKVDTALEPGLTKLSWTSLNIQEYMDKVYKTLADLELLMDRAHDVNEFRIESVLKEMATTTLCQMPEDAPWTVEKFLENTQVRYFVNDEGGYYI